jgi:L-cysteine:1D-myo-inositol 2-amino-2-deoxy-alpha-D-glucopyranoside ligase
MVGYQGHKMSKSRGNLVFVAKLREAGVDPAAIRLALLAHHYRGDWQWRQQDLEEGIQRAHIWRAALARPVAPDAHGLLRAVRQRLADDLDAPGAVLLVDRWAAEAMGGHGTDREAPALVRTLLDTLLGVDLS